MRSYAADTCVGIVASPSTGSAMPAADLISAASVRVKSAVLATSATRYPCAKRRARAAPSPAPTPTTTATGELADTSMQRTLPGCVRSHYGGAPLLRDEGASCNAPGMGAVVGWEIIDPLYYGRYGYPHASWAWLRRHAPVAWFEAPGMLPFWAITKYDDCSAILRDHRRFLIAPRIAVFPEEQAPTDAPPFRHLLNMDPPDHGQYRNLLSQHFTPKALERKRAAVGAIVDETLARVADRTELDFVETVAAIVPLAVIAEMLGIPRDDWPYMFRLSNTLLGAADPEYQQGATLAETAERARNEFQEYFRRLSGARRRDPRDDFITARANAQVGGAPIPEWELLSYYVLLIVAGNETTRNATSGGLLALLESPHEL